MSAVAPPAPGTMTPRSSRPPTGARGRRRASVRALVALGFMLARRGILPVLAMVVCVLTTIATCVIAISFGGRGPHAPIHDVPIVASGALGWGGGFLLAFAASAHALRKDRTDGIRELVTLRSRSLRGYLVARLGGLTALVALLVAGGTLLTGLVAIISATRIGEALRTFHATAAAFVFAIAFSVVVVPVAFAALGARSRLGGYVFFLGLVMLPELFVGAMGPSFPESLGDVLSIPSALAALRTGLAPGNVDIGRAARAIAALAVYVAIAIAFVRRDALAVLDERDER